jgi:hypothetical protein
LALPSCHDPAEQPDTDALTTRQRERIAMLEAIGYVDGTEPAPDLSGVVSHVPELTQAGLNFAVSAHDTEAVLLDMSGRVLHRWNRSWEQTWPDRVAPDNASHWRRGHPFENGDLLAIFEGAGIVKLDKDSNLLWASEISAHHDFEVLPDGRIYVLTRRAHVRPDIDPDDPILEDFISVLTPDGREISQTSLLDIFDNSAPEHSWRSASEAFWAKAESRNFSSDRGDLFHTNSLTVLDGSESDHPAFRQGNLLISMCHLDTIAVVDLEARRVVWSYSDELSLQHDPVMLSDGQILVFDNYWRSDRSRVIAIDPTTRAITRRYGESEGEAFYSKTCGTAQPLPNGNFLITASNTGRALEITPDHQIVWDYYNPHRLYRDLYIATLFEMIRLPVDFPAHWHVGP